MCGGGGDTSLRDQQAEQERRIGYGSGLIDKAYSGFTPQFYADRATAYNNYAMPKLNQQAAQQGKQLDYRMANQGLLNSTAAGDLQSSLNRETATQKQGIIDQGISLSNDLQKNVNQSKSNQVAELQASGNPAASQQSALTAASGFTAPSAFAPVGNLFQQWGNIYGAGQLAQAYAANSPYSTANRGNIGAPTTATTLSVK